MIKNDENKLIQTRWLCLLWPVFSYFSCSGVTDSVIFRKHHFLGPLGCSVSEEAPTLTHCHKVLLVPLHSSSCSTELLVHFPPVLWLWVVLFQCRTLVFVFDKFSEVPIRPLPVFELLNSSSALQHTQLLLPQSLWRHRPAVSSGSLLRMQRVLAWQGALGVTPLTTSHL